MQNAADSSSNGATPANQPDENVEWQLADLVDALTAEIDQAQDTLSLKSYARGLTFAIKTLNLDIEVKARRGADGRFFFRTVGADESSTTVLKLGFAQVLQSQLTTVRKPLEDGQGTDGVGAASLATLDEIATAEEMAALRAVGIHAMNDLTRYIQTPQLVTELSRKTRIAEAQLRAWSGLPFLSEAKPASGPPGSTVMLEGGNLGRTGRVFFQQTELTVFDWRESRLTVAIPAGSFGAGPLVVQVDGQFTNPLLWETASVDLAVRDLVINPAQPVEGDEILVTADLVNQGNLDADAFVVQWTVDDQTAESLPHGPLFAGQRSQESSIRRKLSLSAGVHRVSFLADATGKLADVNRQNGLFSRQVVVRARQTLVLGDFRTIASLDPLRNRQRGPADVLSLIFRGLGRLDPETGQLTPDLAGSWEMRNGTGGTTRWVVRLRNGLSFHDGTPLALDDVKFTYETLLTQADSPWHELAKASISEVRILNRSEQTIALGLLPDQDGIYPQSLPPELLTIGIVPQAAYSADPARFGQRPVGCGPFRLLDFSPNQTIRLAAFRQYGQGQPRLDGIEIQSEADVGRLVELLRTRRVYAAVLPYSEALAEQLSALDLLLQQVSVDLLYVAKDQVNERFPNPYDTNWNAHLWYV